MQRIGSADAGFSVDVDLANQVVKIVGWGFWDAEIAAVFDSVVFDACRAAPKGVGVSIDMRDLKPMRDEGQRTFGQLISRLQQLRLGRIEVITTSHLTKLQLMRIARDAAPKDRVQFI